MSTNYSKSDQDGPRVVSVIQSWHKVGFATPDDPVRMVMRIHTIDGEFIAEIDHFKTWIRGGESCGHF